MTASRTTSTQSRFPSAQRDLQVEIDEDRSGLFETVFTVRVSNALAYRTSVKAVKYLVLHVIASKELVLVENGVAELPSDASSKEIAVKWDINETFEAEDVTFTTCAYVDFEGEVPESDESNNADCFTGSHIH
jgi:hypothetical protein